MSRKTIPLPRVLYHPGAEFSSKCNHGLFIAQKGDDFMATAKKLPSGQYRTLAYDFTDASGKRHYKSFTAATKKESEYLAAEYALNHSEKRTENYTFKEARKLYVESKCNVLSPATIRGYKKTGTYYQELDNYRLKDIKQSVITNWINNFSQTHSPKTTRNAHGFVSAVLKEYAPSVHHH